MTKELLEILACPACGATPLRHDMRPGAEALVCAECKRSFPIADGIPDLMPEPAGALESTDEAWSLWRSKLETFVRWREMTWNGSVQASRLESNVLALKQDFANFISLGRAQERVLDVGCGDGGMRLLLRGSTYHGVDPLIIKGRSYDFPFVRGVGEHLPFASSVFDASILNQVLDHCSSLDGVVREAARVVGPDGSLYVMQFVSEPGTLTELLYQKALDVLLTLRGAKQLDTKTRHFDRRRLSDFFRDRFAHVDLVEAGPSQVFLRATAWKEDQRSVSLSPPSTGRTTSERH